MISPVPGPLTGGEIAASAITTAKLNTGAVTTAKLAESAVTASKIKALAVGSSEIAACAVTTAKINDSGVTAAKIGNCAVTSAKINDSAVTTVKINTGAVTISKLSLDEYDTIYIDAAAMVPCTTNPALQSTHEYGTNDIDADLFAFDAGATEERVQFKNVMPDNWDRGTIKAKFYWSSATGSTAGDTVEFGIQAGALSDSDAIDAALGAPQVISDTLLANNGVDLQISGPTPAITVGGTPALGDAIMFEVYRNTDGVDDMAEDAWLMGVSIQYMKNTNVVVW